MTGTRFIYHGSAVASGGRITDPTPETLEAQAAAVVPAAGGLSRADVDGYSFPNLITYGPASSTVTGTESVRTGKRVFSTVATVTVEGLDVGRGVVTADRVVARLLSEQSEDGEMEIQPVGSHFVNLRVAGTPISPTPHDPLFQGATLDQIAAACSQIASGSASPVEPRGKALNLGGSLPSRVKADGGAPGRYEERTILTALFARPSPLPTGCLEADPGWGIAVPGFGVVYLGELLITRFSRRLTMVRVQLGSPQEGELVVCDIGGNGSTYP